ncbi:uncharacterized protein LOC135109997 [Scylla paramamosain]|uniref:uncharacterized protein LOC135109997 n=1 Tax=Scylla paramamosain TaxID=85552 RepID=UPI0030836E07
MDANMPLMYIILCGILLILSVMVAITCLLVHHKKQLNRLNMEVNQKRVQYRQATNHTSPGRVVDDSYVRPNSLAHPNIGKKPQPMAFHPSPAFMDPNKHYMNVLSESDHSYESLENITN